MRKPANDDTYCKRMDWIDPPRDVQTIAIITKAEPREHPIGVAILCVVGLVLGSLVGFLV